MCACVCVCVCVYECVHSFMHSFMHAFVIIHSNVRIDVTVLLFTVPNEKRNMDVEQVYFPFGRPGGGAPNRSYRTNQTDLSHRVRSFEHCIFDI